MDMENMEVSVFIRASIGYKREDKLGKFFDNSDHAKWHDKHRTVF